MNETNFGSLPDGQMATHFTLGNRNGLEIGLTNYGGIVTRMWVPDRHGQFADVTLGFSRLSPYLEPHPYLGALIGRTTGRIADGQFSLAGKDYQLPLNSGPTHLHGGPVGFSRRLWDASAHASPAGEAVSLSYVSPDGEDGYPAALATKVTYTLTHDNELRIDYEATADGPTLVNLTNHAYFNLKGEGRGDIRDHELQIFSSRIATNRPNLTLDGGIVPVEAETTDFRQPTRIGPRLSKLFLEHGGLYFLDRVGEGKLALAARVAEPSTGRVVEVFTTEPCVQFYSSSHLVCPAPGKSGQIYGKFSGLCLECQRHSDAINHPNVGTLTLLPGEVYRQTTIYRFKSV